jgi:hypothetical protein
MTTDYAALLAALALAPREQHSWIACQLLSRPPAEVIALFHALGDEETWALIDTATESQ